MIRLRLILILSFLGILTYCSVATQSATSKVKDLLNQQFTELESITADTLFKLARHGNATDLKKAFINTRLAYKKLEWFTEYYAPGASRLLNGPPLPEIEIEETKAFEPGGLQVIEEYIFPFEEANRPHLMREIKAFQSKLKRARSVLEDTEFTDAHILDACKLQIFRINALGITGFDTPLSKTGLIEAKASLNAMLSIVRIFGDNDKIENLIVAAGRYIDKNPDFDSFNRMEFLTRFSNPLTVELKRWEKQLNVEPLKTELAIYTRSETLFDPNLFNPNFFAENSEASYTSQKALLGKQLFSDPVLSGSVRSCQSCHKPELAFTDGLAKSPAIIPGTFVKRNAPTLYYAGLQQAQFYDMRAPSLENQAMDVIANKDEMHASVEDAAKRLNSHQEYRKKFKSAFPTMEAEIKPRYVMIALATYLRSLAPFNSRFDKYMRGDSTQMNAKEVAGFNLFMGKGKCGSCHFMPLFNGTAPPAFTNTEAEVLGVPATPNGRLIDADQGRYAHNKIDELKFSFKTPTVRNVGKTAPYMHNGAFSTLEEVMEFYNNGGGAGLGFELENQTLSTDKLNLSKKEQEAIIAFLNTLTDM
ncbi:cytochrome-c peroxidase [Paradesertivirga mongoliensis]|uniref:Cytochrome-c peroxidase n=1 Tax=Paradesertivirga mongoliensis TaxID=2100740 RepID=A0ABW4ZFQ0_9SPHI|nr:cytochrome c peroxidase [Pedobacter mongoliensis]